MSQPPWSAAGKDNVKMLASSSSSSSSASSSLSWSSLLGKSRGRAKHAPVVNKRLTKGRTLEDDELDDRALYKHHQPGGTDLQVAGWQEFYIQTLFRRVHRSMCEVDQSDAPQATSEDESERKADKKMHMKEKQDDEEGEEETQQAQKCDFIDEVKKTAERNLLKVEIREQEIILARFSWVIYPLFCCQP